MKIQAAHYQHLKSEIAKLDINAIRLSILNSDKQPKDFDKRLRWDCLYSAGLSGYTQSATYLDENGDERVMYSGYLHNEGRGNLLLADYIEKRGGKAITWQELDLLLVAHYESLVTLPTEITEKRYYEFLECLPPSRWAQVAGFETFHICERLTANLVQWCAKRGGKCYGFVNRDNLKKEELSAILGGIGHE